MFLVHIECSRTLISTVASDVCKICYLCQSVLQFVYSLPLGVCSWSATNRYYLLNSKLNSEHFCFSVTDSLIDCPKYQA